jgi:catechol 2,3-dioxygenase-like lactoylglutathione lyase family enzyme
MVVSAMWSIHHVNLAAPQIDRARWFFAELLGLSEDPRTRPGGTPGDLRRPGEVAYFGSGNRGIHASRPNATFPRDRGLLHNPTIGGHVAITVDDLGALMARLDRASIPYSDAGVRSLRGVHQLYVYDPSYNLIEFNQIVDGEVPAGIQPWEADWGWGIHHVNLQAHDVRETVGFFAEIAGMQEGRWARPEGADESAFSIDPAELTIFPLGEGNRGLHIIRPDPLFGRRNGFVVNPSIGGHPAIMVPDLRAVMARMDAAGWHYDDAGVYAMPGMHQIYTYDPAMNVIEVNQRVRTG